MNNIISVEGNKGFIFEGEIRQDVVFGLTSLSQLKAAARQLLDTVRNNWGTENSLHYWCDKTLQEDATNNEASSSS